MIDCGEGVQMQLSKYKVKRGNINHIFISHLHGDHYFGLVGLLNSFRLNGRKDDLHLFGPSKLIDIITIQVDVFDEDFGFKTIFHPLNFGVYELIYENSLLEVYTIPLVHKIDTNGFLFKEKPKPKSILKEKIDEYKIPNHLIAGIRNGDDLILDGVLIAKNCELTGESKPTFSYAYCSDTMFSPDIVPLIQHVDLLYHEATFLNDSEDKASERYHSTAAQAATIAKLANAKKLIIGHFSARYADLNPFLSEAKSIFDNTFLATEGEVFSID
jgi:ribonuclease Z